MDKIKHWLFAVAFALASGSLFAEGEAAGDGIDLSAATTALTDVKDKLTDWVSDAIPIIVTIGGAFFAFWLVRFIWGLVKGISNKAK